MNLYEIYEGALENAISNDIVFDAAYIIEYVDGALNAYIPKEMAQKIVDTHNEWLESERGSHNRWLLVESVLEQYEVITD